MVSSRKSSGFSFALALLGGIFFLVAWFALLGRDSNAAKTPLANSLAEYRLSERIRGTGGSPSSPGKFLVATSRMADPRFRETVVLLIEYSGNGAMGLIINRPTEVKLSTLFPGIKDLQRRSETAFIGGPVEMEKCFMLIRSGVAPEDSLHVFSDVYVSTSMRVLQQIAKGGKRGEKFRLYVGYTGWGTGQLQRELSRGQWRILEADPKIVFENDPGKIWQDLIRRSSGVLVRHGQSGSESPTSRKGGGPSLRQSPS